MADSVKIKITGDSKPFSNELESLGKKAKNAIGSAGSVFKGMMASQIVTKGFSMLTNSLRDAINTGMQFEASMSQVAAISGATGQQLELLTETAKHYGETTMFSASQAAEALNYMALAGWDAQQSVDALGGVLDLAAASGMDLGAASDAVTDYLSAFSMEASQAGYMADLMAYAQSKSNTTAAMLADAYGNCASAMHAAGQDIETTTAMLMALANQGIKGSEAGTQMAAVMRDITSNMDKGQIMIGKTAVKVTDAAGNFRDLNDIISDVAKATDGLGTAEASAALMETFTARSVKAVQTLLNEGIQNVNEYENALRNSEGTAAEQAEKMMDNLQGDIKIFRSALEGLQITASESTNGIARSLVQEATSILQSVNEAGKSGGIGGMFDAVIAQIPNLLPKVTKGVQSLLSALGKRLPGLVKNLIATLPDLLGNIGEVIPMLVDSLSGALSSAIEGIIPNLPRIVKSLAIGLWKTLLSTLKGAGNIGMSLMESLFGSIKPTEYEAFDVTGELTYAVDTQATVDNSGARKDVETARQSFIEELQGYGLTSDEIVEILGFTGTEEEIHSKLEENYPDLTEAQRNAIVAKLTSESGESIQSVAADLKGYGLTAAQIVEILAFDGDETELEEKLKETLPDLKSIQIHAIQAKLTSSQDAGTADLVSDATDMGLTAEQIAQLLAFTGTEEEVKAAIKALLPNLTQAQHDALFEHFTEQDFTSTLSQLATELGDLGLTGEQIASLLVIQGEDGDLETAIKDLLPDLDAAAQKAIYNKLNEGGGITASVTDELSNMGISNDDIVKLLTWQIEGDTASIESLLEEKYGELDIKGKAISALEKAWNSSEATFSSGVGDSSLGYMAQLLTDMFTDGVKDDDASVEAMISNAKTVIDTARRKLNEYIANGGEDTEGAQNALTQLDELDSAFTDYATNYKNASITVCEEQGKVLQDMARQCQETVDSITASSQQLMSLQEILFHQGVAGSKLSESDLEGATLFIATKYRQRVDDAKEARDNALLAGATYEEAEALYTAGVKAALQNSTKEIADLIRGQAGYNEDLDVGAALTNVWDQIEAAAEESGKYLQSDIEGILRDAGWGDDIIGKAIEKLFGEQKYDPKQNAAEILAGLDLDAGIKATLMSYLNNGNLTPETIASSLEGTDWSGLIPDTIAQLLTPNNMSADYLDLDTILQYFDFEGLGRVLQTAVENGMIEGIDSTEGIDINKLILDIIGEAAKQEYSAETKATTTVDVEVEAGEVTTGEDVSEKIEAAVEKAATETEPEAEVEATVDVKPEAEQKTEEVTMDVTATLNVTSSNAAEVGGQVGQEFNSGIAGESAGAAEAGTSLAAAAASGAGQAYAGMYTAGSHAGNGFYLGFLSKRGQIIRAAQEMANSVASTIRAALEINSPSRVTKELGAFTGEGFGIGLKESLRAAIRSAQSVVGVANLSPKMDFSSVTSAIQAQGTMDDLADIESQRPINLYLGDKEVASTMRKAHASTANQYNRSVALGVGQ